MLNAMKFLEDALAAGNGSLSDLGEPPIVGAHPRIKDKKKDLEKPVFMKLESLLNEADEELEDEDSKALMRDESDDRISMEGDKEFETPPIYGEDEGVEGEVGQVGEPQISDEEDAEEYLEQTTPGAEDEEDVEEDPVTKIPLRQIMQYRVHKRMTGRHAKPGETGNRFSPKTLDDMRIGESMKRLREAIGEGGNSPAEDEEDGEGMGPKVVLARLTHNQGNFILSTTITAGRENRDYVFSGDRTRIVAILIVLGASVRNQSGTPQDAVSFATKTADPVEMVVNYDRLLTYGQSYAQQVIAQ